jgi:predicted  nucleic acid-binding Zn-ribbon protein
MKKPKKKVASRPSTADLARLTGELQLVEKREAAAATAVKTAKAEIKRLRKVQKQAKKEAKTARKEAKALARSLKHARAKAGKHPKKTSRARTSTTTRPVLVKVPVTESDRTSAAGRAASSE